MKNEFSGLIFRLIGSGILTALISACGPSASVDTVASNTVDSSQIYQDYRITGDGSQAKIVATFRVGGATGTTLELKSPGKILYNGASMIFSAPGGVMNVRTKGTTYETTVQNFPAVNKFDYTDADGRTYSNSINFSSVQIAAQAPLILQRNRPAVLQLSRPIGADEKIRVQYDSGFRDDVPNSDNSLTFNPARSAIIFTPQYWSSAKNLAAKNTVRLEVTKTASVAKGTATGGAISIEFTTSAFAVNVNKSGKLSVNANSGKNPVNADFNQHNSNANISQISETDSNTGAVAADIAPANAAPRKPRRGRKR